MPRIAPFVVLVALAAGVPTEALAKWTELRTANFVFVGDASERQIRATAQRLEQFRDVLALILPGATAAPVPTVVVVFANDRSFRPYKPLYEGKPIDVAGWFQSSEDINYIALSADAGELAYRTVFHEYAHFVTAHGAGRVPVWVSEGLAEVYENFEERQGGRAALIGRAPSHHLDLLRTSTLMPLRELLAVDSSSPVYNEGNRRGVFYAQSWALMHYLMLGNQARAAELRAYLGRIRTGDAPDQAFRDSFGSDLRPLENELSGYVRRYAFNAVQLEFDGKISQGIPGRGEELSNDEALGYLGDLLARIDRPDEARATLGKVLAANPAAVRAGVALGLLELRAGKLDAAMPLLERAARAAAADGPAQTAFGRALIARLQEQQGNRGEMTATLQQAQATLSRAVELDARAYTLALAGYVELVAGTDLTRAASLLERAAREAPVREQYQLMAADALMRLREFDRATKYLGPLLASGSRADIRDDARRRLVTVAALRTAAAAPASSGRSRSEPTPAELPLASPAGSASPPAPGPRLILDLRPVGEGEVRVLGMFRSVECRADGVVLHIETGGKVLHLGAAKFDQVHFISFVADAPRSVSCGPQEAAARVLATYRPGDVPGTDGLAVAIELIPGDYQPD
jgi:tetratricopeptide (TPR) repeat protein